MDDEPLEEEEPAPASFEGELLPPDVSPDVADPLDSDEPDAAAPDLDPPAPPSPEDRESVR